MILRTCDNFRRTYACFDRHLNHLQTWTAKIRLFALRKMNNLGPHADECSVARSLIYVLSLNLYSYYVHASNVGSIKSAHMHACPSIARRCGIKKQKWTAWVLQPIVINKRQRRDVARDSWRLAQYVIKL